MWIWIHFELTIVYTHTQLIEAKKFPVIFVVTPDWLWACAERWERVEELLYPLNSDVGSVRRKPPPHCTSPDLKVQFAMTAASKEESGRAAVYDRVTGKRIFRHSKTEREKSLAPLRTKNVSYYFFILPNESRIDSRLAA